MFRCCPARCAQLAERPRPARPGRHRPRAGAPGRVTARSPRPGRGSRSPRRGPRPAPTSVPAPARSSRRPARETRARTRRSRRPASIRSLIVTRPACQPRSGNWTPSRPTPVVTAVSSRADYRSRDSHPGASGTHLAGSHETGQACPPWAELGPGSADLQNGDRGGGEPGPHAVQDVRRQCAAREPPTASVTVPASTSASTRTAESCPTTTTVPAAEGAPRMMPISPAGDAP